MPTKLNRRVIEGVVRCLDLMESNDSLAGFLAALSASNFVLSGVHLSRHHWTAGALLFFIGSVGEFISYSYAMGHLTRP